MEFWSKGLGKRTIAMGLTKGESLVSVDALCLKGTMDEPVTWEYVMLLDESDFLDFFELLREPGLARYVHASPGRWRLYAGFLVGAAKIAWLVVKALLRNRQGRSEQAERVVIELPPAYVAKQHTKKRAYRRRLSTTTLAAPSMADASASGGSAAAREAGVS